MSSNKTKSARKAGSKRYASIFLLSLAFYLIFFTAGFAILHLSIRHETGQYNPAETYYGESLSRSLDLNLAAKADYSAPAVSIVKNMGTDGGVTEQLFSFKVPLDGLTEYGLLAVPAYKAPPGGFPVIILCHGYASPTRYSTLASYRTDMLYYAGRGFAVFKPDFRGQGYSMQAGLATSGYYSMDYNTDIMSLISAVKKVKFINKSRINLWGHSLGAYIALRAAVLSPDIRNVILLSGPVDSLSKMYLTYVPPSDENNLNALKTRSQIFDKYGIPSENNTFWRNASPINMVQRVKAHIQIHVGSLDQVVPPQFSADLDKALSAKHIKHDYYVYPDGFHSLGPQRDLVWSRSLAVLESQVSPPAPVL